MKYSMYAGLILLSHFALGDVLAKSMSSDVCWACSHRSQFAKNQFKRITGYPKGRPGYVIDHIDPLVCGGKDDPSNMQWQTLAESKEKDQWEAIGCSGGHRYAPSLFQIQHK